MSDIVVQNAISAIIVEGEVNTALVENVVASIEVSPVGMTGLSTGVYTHDQSSAATTWTVNHNLGFRPAISVLTPGGSEMEVEILHVSTNQALLYLLTAMAGTAICS